MSPKKEANHKKQKEQEHYLLLPIPGIVHPLKICFPEGKLPVCTKCKYHYKSRNYCRPNHKSFPWCTIYLCLTFDKSCFLEDERGLLQLKSGENMNFAVQNVQPHNTRGYKIKEHSLSLLRRKKDKQKAADHENNGITKEDRSGNEDDDSSAEKNVEKFLSPLCMHCKKKRYGGTYCRGEPNSHRYLPWNTHYFEVSCNTVEDQNIHGFKKKNGEDTTSSGIFENIDHESRTLFVQVSADKYEVEWIDASVETNEELPTVQRSSPKSNTYHEQTVVDNIEAVSPFSVNSNYCMNTTTQQEQQEETKNKVNNHLDLIRQDGHNFPPFYLSGDQAARTTNHFHPFMLPQRTIPHDAHVYLPPPEYTGMIRSCCPLDHNGFTVANPFQDQYGTYCHDHDQPRLPTWTQLESYPPFSLNSHKNEVQTTRKTEMFIEREKVYHNSQKLVVTANNNKRKKEEDYDCTEKEGESDYLNLWIDNFLKNS